MGLEGLNEGLEDWQAIGEATVAFIKHLRRCLVLDALP